MDADSDIFLGFSRKQHSHRQFAQPNAFELTFDRSRLLRCIVAAFDSINGERVRVVFVIE